MRLLVLLIAVLAMALPARADGLTPRGTTSLGLCYAAGSSGAQVPCVLSGQTWVRLLKSTDSVPVSGDASASTVTAGGTTQALSQWLPSFAQFGVPNSGKQMFLPWLSVGRPITAAPWVDNDNLIGSTAPGRVQKFVVSPNGGYSAQVTAARTSDNTGAPDNVLTDTCLSVHDNPSVAHLNWCRYTHTSLKPGAAVSLSLGEENSLENLSSYSVAIDPFSNMGPGSGVTGALRLTSGIGRPANDISSYLQMINNGGARAKAGMVFSWDALNTSSGYAPALSMGPQQGLSWYNGQGALGWRIYQNSNAGGGTVLLDNDRLDIFVGAGGAMPLRVDASGLTVQGRVRPSGPVQLASYTAGTLPNCQNDDNRGAMVMITDAPANYGYRQAAAGGGTTRAPVFCTGGQWEFH